MARRDNVGLLYALSLVWEVGFFIVVPVGGFLFLGYVGDRWLGTQPIFLIAGIIMGVIVAFYGVYRSLIPLMKNDDNNHDEA